MLRAFAVDGGIDLVVFVFDLPQPVDDGFVVAIHPLDIRFSLFYGLLNCAAGVAGVLMSEAFELKR